MKHTFAKLPRFIAISTLLALIVPSVVAYTPSFLNTKGESTQDIPLGPIMGVGRMTFNEPQMEVVDLYAGGPGASAGLLVGDIVTGVNGKEFVTYRRSNATGGEGAPEDLGRAILAAQAGGDPVVLNLRGKDDITLSLPPLPDFIQGYPTADCERTQLQIRANAEWLAERQRPNGSWARDYATAFAGLALLATGDDKYLPHIQRTAGLFNTRYDLGGSPTTEGLLNEPDSNWDIPAAGIFLAEYILATGDTRVARALRHNCERMYARLCRRTGRLGHGTTVLPYDGNGLVMPNVHSHVMWSLADHAGYPIDPEGWALSWKSVEASMSNNAVGYNASARGGYQGGGRTGLMATAFGLRGTTDTTARNMGRWLGEHYREFPDAHAMTTTGLVMGLCGLRNASERNWRSAMDYKRWMWALATPDDPAVRSFYFPSKSNIGGDGYLNMELSGVWMTLLSLAAYREDTLWIFGNREKGWLTGREVASINDGTERLPRAGIRPESIPGLDDVVNPATQHVRTIRNLEGRAIQARIVNADSEMVVLENPSDKRIFNVRLDSLSREDQEAIRRDFDL